MKCWDCGYDKSFVSLSKQHNLATAFVQCPSCSAPNLLELENLSAFEVFGEPRQFQVNHETLENKYFSLSKALHPDRHSLKTDLWKKKCADFSALLNSSYSLLKDPEPRLNLLVSLLSKEEIASSRNMKKEIPFDLAERFFEIQEFNAENPSKAVVLAKEFLSEITTLERQCTNEMILAAEKISWENKASALQLSPLISLQNKLAYIRSLIENLKKVAV